LLAKFFSFADLLSFLDDLFSSFFGTSMLCFTDVLSIFSLDTFNKLPFTPSEDMELFCLPSLGDLGRVVGI
jgi:hypothetical protein